MITPFSTQQQKLVDTPLEGATFLEGPAGYGKTTAGIQRLLALLRSGVPGDSILVLVPQRTLGVPYQEALQECDLPGSGMVSLATVGGIARRMVELFWPLVSGPAGFSNPAEPPNFLTLETAQYYMAHLVRPLLEDQGYFDSVTIDRNRLYSQILDNLNKAALVGFAYTEIGPRLQAAWSGEPVQERVYQDTQDCASRFRAYCLEHNLLDFSLQYEIFLHRLWPSLLCREYLKKSYRHLIFDNLEEDTPAAHDLLREWLPSFTSALLISDSDAGFRAFLGADPDSALSLKDDCDQQVTFSESFVTPAPLEYFARRIGQSLGQTVALPPRPKKSAPVKDVICFPEQRLRFYPQMLDWVTSEISMLVQNGTPPGEIAVLAPFLTDSLRFALSSRLEIAGVAARSHRPSRPLREEPAARCLLTLAQLAHPEWEMRPQKADVAFALCEAIQDLDPVRAQILVEVTLRSRQGVPSLVSFEGIVPQTQQRITYTLGSRYERLRAWLEIQDPQVELDHFISSLFGEVLSQPGFAFHSNLDAGRVTATLIESMMKFRRAAGANLQKEGFSTGKEYLQMVQDGVIAAQYVQSWQAPDTNAVLLAPAYTFLMNNQPVDHLFWLDVGSSGWSERLEQPLTQPYVLSRRWREGQKWTEQDEVEIGRDNLYRLVLGLVRRCRVRITLGLSELNVQGNEARGPLLKSIQRALLG
jgi:hypothetical protein